MKKFEKAVAVSTLSVVLTAGMYAVGAAVNHSQNGDRRACFADLNGQDQSDCLNGLSNNQASKSALELVELFGAIGALAGGVQAYRALDKEI